MAALPPISSPPPALYARLPAHEEKSPNSPENLKKVAQEVADLYAFFLTPQSHEDPICPELRKKGMWINMRDKGQPYPSEEEIKTFKGNLTELIEAKLSEQDPRLRGRITLSVDYGPEGDLKDALKHIEWSASQPLLPSKSFTEIGISNDKLSLRISLRGPLF